jgi:hypothetical protein
MRIALAAATSWVVVSLLLAVGIGRLLHGVERRAGSVGRRSTMRRAEDAVADPSASRPGGAGLPERRYGT